MPTSNGTTQTTSSRRTAESVSDQSETTFQYCCGQAAQFAKDNPTTTVMAVFAAGLGVGAVVGSVIAGSAPRSTTSFVTSRAEEFGKRIAAALSDVIPDTLRS